MLPEAGNYLAGNAMPVTVNLPNHAHSPRPLVSGNRPGTSENKRTERGTIMLKHTFRWILPLVVIAVVALCLVLSPVVATHAAAPAILHHAAASHGVNPNWFWRP